MQKKVPGTFFCMGKLVGVSEVGWGKCIFDKFADSEVDEFIVVDDLHIFIFVTV